MAARFGYAECAARVRKAGHQADVLGCTIALADIRVTQGHLREAMAAYEVGLELHAATQHLLKSQELGEHTGLPQNRYRWRVAMARVREAEGDLDGAFALLNEAERLCERLLPECAAGPRIEGTALDRAGQTR